MIILMPLVPAKDNTVSLVYILSPKIACAFCLKQMVHVSNFCVKLLHTWIK